MQDAFIIDAVRTPRARKKGRLSSAHPVDLLTYPLNSLTQRQDIPPREVEDVLIGCVTQCGEQGWCVARSAVLAAGWPETVPASTINRLCGSSLQALNSAAAFVQSGQAGLVVAGGLEHMTRCPMFSDLGGEESPMLKAQYPDLVQQGMAAEIMAETFKVSRQQLDEFALESHMRAARAQREGRFARSLVPVPCRNENGEETIFSEDDGIRPFTSMEALAGLKTVFKDAGVITAGNASAIVDGAAAILVAGEKKIKELNLKPRARIVTSFVTGTPPRIMLTGPVPASQGALKRAGLERKDIDIWEINEAFGVVPLVAMQELDIDPLKVNINGGAIAMGHPLGATGAMLANTALDELERSSKRYALISMCIGLGMGIATIIERV